MQFHSIYFNDTAKKNQYYISRKFLINKISLAISGSSDCLLFSKMRPDALNTRSDVAELVGTPNKRLFIKNRPKLLSNSLELILITECSHFL